MTIAIPQGRPNKRFMRYVRPPIGETTPLPPLRPETWPMRLGIDVETIPEPPEDGYLTGPERLLRSSHCCEWRLAKRMPPTPAPPASVNRR